MKQPAVLARLETLKAERSERTGITQDRVLEEIEPVAFSRLHDVVDWKDGKLRLRDPDEIPPNVHKGIKTLKAKERVITRRDGTTETIREFEVTMHDKVKTLHLAAKHAGVPGLAKAGADGPRGVLVIVQRPE
jgi:phage terminase small subunit